MSAFKSEPIGRRRVLTCRAAEALAATSSARLSSPAIPDVSLSEIEMPAPQIRQQYPLVRHQKSKTPMSTKQKTSVKPHTELLAARFEKGFESRVLFAYEQTRRNNSSVSDSHKAGMASIGRARAFWIRRPLNPEQPTTIIFLTARDGCQCFQFI